MEALVEKLLARRSEFGRRLKDSGGRIEAISKWVGKKKCGEEVGKRTVGTNIAGRVN